MTENVNVFVEIMPQGKTNILESVYYCAFAKITQEHQKIKN
ncbi:recombinational DNA repair ATPase RecF [Clostridium beijerinckii]|nr:recombinational DNA repair ATPase RecF [Clostridium beijerinckii]